METQKRSPQAEMTEEKNILAIKGSNCRSLLLFGGVITFVIIALALGLGLGLGLKHHIHGEAAATNPTSRPAPSPSPTAPSDASENVQSWRRSTLEYDLDMNWDANASPTIRLFNFTISEIQAAPDGKILYLEYLFLR